jgi:type IV pilus assembly protein PilM
MASARFAWGIDVGNRALKAVKLVREGDRLRVDDFEVIEYEQVLSNAGDNRDALIQAAVAQFVQKHGTRGGVASIGVSGQSSFARFIKLPPVERKKIPEIVKFEAIQQIPFPLDDVEWSYQLFETPDSPDIEVGIFAMRRELINQQMRFFTEADLNVQVVQMNPLAVYNAMYYDGQVDGTTMIIDMGAENTDLIIADGESVWLRSIPIGGNNFTESLVKAFKLNFQKAEEMKRNASTSKYARQIFQAMRPIFADLVAEVQRSIGFYASTHRDSRITKIVASGGTFRLPGLQKYLQQNLQLNVQVLDGFSAGAPADGKQAAAFNENLLSLGAAYGLAVQAMGDGKINSSLLPASIRRAKMWKEKTKWFAAAAALFLVGTGIAYGRAYYEDMKAHSSSSQEKLSQVGRIRSDAERLDREWTAIEQAGTGERTQIANYQGLLQYRNLWPNILLDVQRSLPKPQQEVLSGKRDLIAKVPRGDRNQIVIDSINSHYYPDLKSVLAMPNNGWTSFAPTPEQPMGNPQIPQGVDASALGPDPMRGFLVTIVCTTPNKGGYGYVAQTLVQALEKIKPGQPGFGNRNFYVQRAQIVNATRLDRLPNRLAELDRALQTIRTGQGSQSGGYPGGGGMGPGGAPEDMSMIDMGGAPAGVLPGGPVGSPTQPALPPDQNPYLDRVTGEDVRQDTEVRLVAAIVLDPPAALPTTAPAATTDPAAATTPPPAQ